jgi:hypothetical protein
MTYLKFPALIIDKGNVICEDRQEDSCSLFIRSQIST